MRHTSHEQLQRHSVSIELGGEKYEGGYVHEHGVVSVVWYNAAVDLKLHQLGKVSSDPAADATELLRAIVISATCRGEL